MGSLQIRTKTRGFNMAFLNSHETAPLLTANDVRKFSQTAALHSRSFAPSKLHFLHLGTNPESQKYRPMTDKKEASSLLPPLSSTGPRCSGLERAVLSESHVMPRPILSDWGFSLVTAI